MTRPVMVALGAVAFLLVSAALLTGCEGGVDKQRQSLDDLACLTESERYAAYWQNDTGGAMIANELRLIRGGGECPPTMQGQPASNAGDLPGDRS